MINNSAFNLYDGIDFTLCTTFRVTSTDEAKFLLQSKSAGLSDSLDLDDFAQIIEDSQALSLSHTNQE